MKLLFSILFLTIYNYSTSQIDSAFISKGEFPENWDENHELLGQSQRKKVLIWVQHNYLHGPNVRSCITFYQDKDSTGKPEYNFIHEYSNDSTFKKWDYSSIHYLIQPDSINKNKLTFGFWDIHLTDFDHQPSEKEIYELFNRWKFSIYKSNAKIIEAGIDEKLWMNIFGFIPDPHFGKK